MASLLTARSLRPSARGPQLHTFIPRARSVHPWLAVETARLPGAEAPAPALPLVKVSRGQWANSPAPWPLNEKGPDALSTHVRLSAAPLPCPTSPALCGLSQDRLLK